MLLIILLCIYPTRDGKIFQSDRVSGVIDALKPLTYYILYYVLLKCRYTLRVRPTSSSGQLYYTSLCLFMISSCLLSPSGVVAKHDEQ